ncbi:MAG TPA: FtsW/RodA/SpoVE family cell cycle protein, partial [Acidimicrobiales bacterium]
MGTRRRNTELGLLVMVVVIIGAAYVLASLGSEKKIPLDIGPFLLIVLGLMLFAHLVVRRLAPDADPILLPVAALLNGLGYVMVASLAEANGNTKLAGLQSLWTAVGIAAFVAVLLLVRRTRVIERYRYTFALLGLGLLMLPLVPGVGREVNGSRIWVSVGGVGFQP